MYASGELACVHCLTVSEGLQALTEALCAIFEGALACAGAALQTAARELNARPRSSHAQQPCVQNTGFCDDSLPEQQLPLCTGLFAGELQHRTLEQREDTHAWLVSRCLLMPPCFLLGQLGHLRR